VAVLGEADGVVVLNAVNEIEVIQATLLRTLASVHRLRIIHLLGRAALEVRELEAELGLPQATVSQHLSVMRSVGLVTATRDGRTVRYELADPEILAACDLMRGVLVRRLSALGSLAAAAHDDEERRRFRDPVIPSRQRPR
jgi:ArsR family transcriptional regulator, virulence genes transcriptional regulator